MAMAYWIQDVAGKTWLKVPQLAPGEQRVFKVAADVGQSPDPHSTLEFYEDFSSGVNLSIWEPHGTAGSYSVTNGTLKIDYTGAEDVVYGLHTKAQVVPENCIVEVYSKPLTGRHADAVAYGQSPFIVGPHTGSVGAAAYLQPDSGTDIFSWNDGATAGMSVLTSRTTYAVHKIRHVDGSLEYYRDDSLAASVDIVIPGPNYLYFSGDQWSSDSATFIDWIIVRKCAVVEPTVQILPVTGGYHIIVTNTGDTELTDYQVAVNSSDLGITTVDDGLLIEPVQIEPISFWHESTTKSWMKVPELLPFETRMFYAKKVAGYSPNGVAIFDKLFEEFDGSSVDTNKWTVISSAGISVANGVLTATNTSGWLESKETFGDEDIVLETRFEHVTMPDNGYNPLSLWNSATDTFGALLHPDNSDIKVFYRNNGNWITITSGITGITDITCRIIIHTDGTCDIQYINNDTGVVFSEALGVSNVINNEPIRFIRREDDDSSYYNQTFEANFHHVIARKYIETEPTISVKDCGSFCQITVTNNTNEVLTDCQVSFDSTPLNLSSTDDSLLILPMHRSEQSNVPYMDLFDGCVAYYDFRGDAQDVMGNHDGTVTGASLTTDHLGVQNAAYKRYIGRIRSDRHLPT